MTSPEDKAVFNAGVETHIHEILAVLALGGPLPDDPAETEERIVAARSAMSSRELLADVVGSENAAAMKQAAISRLQFLFQVDQGEIQ